MKLLLCIFITSIGLSHAQNCPNSNFSLNNFNNWNGTSGTVPNNGGTPYDIPGFVVGQHEIISTPGLDPNTGNALSFPPPGSNFVCKLGNNIPNYGAESMSFLITVDQTNRLFVYQYAMVLQAPGHAVLDEPRFIVKITDVNGNLLPGNCSYYETYGSDPNNNFNNYAGTAFSTWKDVAIDLTPYLNQTLKIQFTTLDCGLGAHFGYAYLTASCGPFAIDIDQQCNGDITLIAPPGFQSYLWNPGGYTTSSVTLNNPPSGNYTYSCLLTPVTGISCLISIDTSFNFISAPSVSVNDTTICMGESVLLNAISTEVGGVFNWPQNNSSNSSIWVTPQVDANYIVTYAALNGCVYSDTSFISVNELPEMYLPNISICNGEFFELNPIPNWYIYNWSSGLTNNTPILLNSSISPTVEIINPITGCKNYDTINIVINPLPQASFSYDCESFPPLFFNSSFGSLLAHWEFNGNTIDLEPQVPLILPNFESEDITLTLIAESEFGCKDSISRKIILPNFCYVPNTFTPDGDEYNNVFVPIFYNYLTIIDYELTIFNRWGELIFTSYNPKIGWDGVVMKSSKKGQDDVYNWCLKYNDMSCPKRKEIIGHVTLIR